MCQVDLVGVDLVELIRWELILWELISREGTKFWHGAHAHNHDLRTVFALELFEAACNYRNTGDSKLRIDKFTLSLSQVFHTYSL